MSFENITCLMVVGATPIMYTCESVCIDFQLKPSNPRAFRLHTFDCLCRDVEHLFILCVYLSMRRYRGKKTFFNSIQFAHAREKTNQIEHVVWVTRQDVCEWEHEREGEWRKVKDRFIAFIVRCNCNVAMCSRWFWMTSLCMDVCVCVWV